jgi:hypothetical protein
VKLLAAVLSLTVPSGLLVACSSGPAANLAQVTADQGGSITLAGATLSVPPGAVSGHGYLHASTAAAPPRSTQQAGARSPALVSGVSAPVHFTVSGARLVRPVRITFRVHPGPLPSALPAASRASAVWLSFYNPAARRWQAVATQYDRATGTVTAEVQHLSWWMPWTWDWAGTVRRLRQALSAFGSGRAPPASCQGVPQVTLTNLGGQDPPLIGCAARAGPGALTVSLTNNRGLSMVMSAVPADATPGPASYTGVAAFLTDEAFREAFTRRLGGAILPAAETIPYSVPLHGATEDFTASITVRSYLLDLALAAGEAGFGGITNGYVTCLLNTVLRSKAPPLADLPGLATSCLPVLAETSPALKDLAKALGKKFLAVVGLVITDLKLILQTSDIVYDQFRGVQGQVQIERPGAASSPGTVPLGYSQYTSPRFGFTAIWPSTFTTQPPPEDGDGQGWTSPNGLVKLSAFGANNILNESPQQDESVDSQGLSVVYRNITGNIVTVSGYKDEGRIIVYQQDVVGSGSIDTLYWSYPASQKAQWDAAVTLTADAFQPGDVATSH